MHLSAGLYPDKTGLVHFLAGLSFVKMVGLSYKLQVYDQIFGINFDFRGFVILKSFLNYYFQNNNVKV